MDDASDAAPLLASLRERAAEIEAAVHLVRPKWREGVGRGSTELGKRAREKRESISIRWREQSALSLSPTFFSTSSSSLKPFLLGRGRPPRGLGRREARAAGLHRRAGRVPLPAEEAAAEPGGDEEGEGGGGGGGEGESKGGGGGGKPGDGDDDCDDNGHRSCFRSLFLIDLEPPFADPRVQRHNRAPRPRGSGPLRRGPRGREGPAPGRRQEAGRGPERGEGEGRWRRERHLKPFLSAPSFRFFWSSSSLGIQVPGGPRQGRGRRLGLSAGGLAGHAAADPARSRRGRGRAGRQGAARRRETRKRSGGEGRGDGRGQGEGAGDERGGEAGQAEDGALLPEGQGASWEEKEKKREERKEKERETVHFFFFSFFISRVSFYQ